jgi:hypothetical protein
MSAPRTWLRCLLTVAASLVASATAAQQYGVYLACSGKVQAQGQAKDAHLDVALRRNSGLAMVQRSDVLPVGDRLKLEITPAFYSMVFRAPAKGSAVYYGWIRGPIFIWYPDLQRLQSARISINRQSAELEGELLDALDHPLARLAMRCEPKTNDNVPEPKF